VLEANYSVALMLLLKYPSPSRPHDPRTFVDDAIYLRNNFSAAGGATLIAKYSGKSPPVYSSASRPSTPLGEGVGQKHKIWRARSPLQTPVRFLQQQGGVEALFQGAAKGVFDRGERLGINQAVRDAVGEVKKNMKGLHASRITSPTRRTSDMMRWSLDEGRSVPSQNTFESAMKTRNQQLALMLDEAMADLRDLSVSTDDDKDKYIKGIDLAIAKIGFVKVYLEDSEIPLPFSPSNLAPESPSSSIAKTSPKSPEQAPSQRPAVTRVTTTAGHKLKTASSSDLSLPSTPTPESLTGENSPAVQSSSDVVQDPLSKTPVELAEDIGPPSRPISSLPTRSSIAQSNFSWMLEPDDSSASGVKSAPPKSSSPFLKSGRRPNSGQGREKAAFLFGEESGEPQIPSNRKSVSAESFSLGPMKGGEDNNEEPVDA
jgi:TBC1 domain family protein 5